MLRLNKKILSILMIMTIIAVFPGISYGDEGNSNIENQIEMEQDFNDEKSIELSGINTAPILGKSTTTVYQMKSWARSRGANQKFIDLAQVFYDISVARGVNPAVTYVQSAKETNFMKFGGVLDASYNNPCGMKLSIGGSDTDAKAHKVFASWNDGIQAQVDHLALYAGKAGYPKYSEDLKQYYISQGLNYDPNGVYLKNGKTTDPRHFASIYGVAKNVEDLGGRWAPSPSYGTDMLSMMDQLYAFPYSTVLRYSGSDRYETSKAINKAVNNNSNIAVISSGNSYSDTILASVLAGELGGRHYINAPNSYTQEISDTINSGVINTVYKVGGLAFPESVKRIISSKNINIIEISGSNRFETSATIASKYSKKSKVFLANGIIFPDALSIAPAALKHGYSLVLTDGSSLTNSVKSILNKADEIVIVGGTNSVSANIENDLKKSNRNVSRISGADRYETSIAIGKKYFSSTDFIVGASGLNYADALTGTSLAKKLSSPILLLSGNNLTNSQKNYIMSNKINTFYLLGGTASLNKNIESNIKSLLDY